MSSNHIDVDPLHYQSEVLKKGLGYERPPLTFDTTQWEALAGKILSANARNYLFGNSGTGQTCENNLSAFRKWAFIPKRLTGQQKLPDLSVSLFGKKYIYPIAVAPVGVQTIFHPEGERATAKAAVLEGVPYICSSASATSIEDVANANSGGERWFQLYWPSNLHNAITKSILGRAQNSGYDVLVVNVDTYILGWRPCDMDNGYSPLLRADHVGVEIGLTDPVFKKLFKEKFGNEVEEDLATAAVTWAKIYTSGFPHSWHDLEFLRANWKGPIVVKGVLSVEDAESCIKAGMDGIIVSNHGGREVDAGVAALDMLPEIVDAVGDKLEVLYDSGVRNGTDILKALSMGAKMVCVGRPWVYGLAIEGEAGVRHVLRSLLGELDLNIHLMGLGSVRQDELNRKLLRKVER
jgi:lactate 2-monooxygenase